MTHLLERHRNARFMSHMDNFLPNWQSIKQQLNALELFAQIYNLT
ncbi:M48 family metallopeptidase [Neisseria meningitidis]|nr:M48 family metallopeptidase [Neisseria meningitidis]